MPYIAINTSDANAPRAQELMSLMTQAQALRAKARVIKESMEVINSDEGLSAAAVKFGIDSGDAVETYQIIVSVLKLADGTAEACDLEALHDICTSFGR